MFKTSELEELFKENYDALCMFSMHYVEGFEAAEDIVMDSFSKLYEKVSAGEKIVFPKLYLYQMTKNASIDYVRKKLNLSPIVWRVLSGCLKPRWMS